MMHMVFVRVHGVDYLVKVLGENHLSAEHYYLDRGICGKHEYGVESAQAFNPSEMRTELFVALATSALLVSNDELFRIIDENNSRIQEADKREEERERVLAEIAKLEKRLAELRSKV